MPRAKGHPEFIHMDPIEYRRAVNRLHANSCYKRKQIQRLKEKLARLESTPDTAPVAPVVAQETT
jgi:hypothetical protein